MRQLRSGLCCLALLVVPFFLPACTPKPDTAQTPDQEEEQFLQSVRGQVAGAPQSNKTDVATATQGAPKIELQTTDYDMGIIGPTEVSVQSVKVFNRGAGPLKIDRVKTSCGCTTGEMEDNIIPPGGEGKLIIHVDPKRVSGFKVTKILTLYSNDPATPQATLNVTSAVAPEMEIEPAVVDFGRVSEGEDVKQTVHIRQLQETPLEISAVAFQKDLPYLAASFAPVPEAEWRTPGKREYTVTLEVKPDAPAGHQDEWFIVSSNVARMPQMSIKFKGAIVGPYEFAPPTVTLRGVIPGQPQKDALKLTGKEAVKVLEVANSNESIKVTFHATDDPHVVAFDAVAPQRSATLALRDTWRITFETAGKRHEEIVPVVLVLVNGN